MDNIRDINTKKESNKSKNVSEHFIELCLRDLIVEENWNSTESKHYRNLLNLYHRKMNECQTQKNKLKVSDIEIERLILAVSNLMSKLEKLLTSGYGDKILCPVSFPDGCDGNDGRDDATSLEEFTKKLMDNLCACENLTEEVSGKLAVVKALLAQSENDEEHLRNRVKALITIGCESAQIKSWDRDEDEIRTEVDRMSDELMNDGGTDVRNLRLTTERKTEALDETVIPIMDGAIDTLRCVSTIVADNIRLATELEGSRVAEETLGVKLIALRSADECRQRTGSMTVATEEENAQRQQFRNEKQRPCSSSSSIGDYNSPECTVSRVSSCATLVCDYHTDGRTRLTSSSSLSVVDGSAVYNNYNGDFQRSRSLELITPCVSIESVDKSF
ncbi:Hypothetical protein CINCED_3A009210 [Cinara cedri]|uniref:Uncharacterized protein n=1 Tax=Cinara cedri TaxID=506608 RepID=A0A5E4NHC0_9HEMI|nr:Hypothetical protein CINCED_3A009210 [Cinara cedri]